MIPRDDHEMTGAVTRTESALARLDDLGDADARAAALDAVQGVIGLYGEGLARILAYGGPHLAAALAADDLVSHLLCLHGLHPVDVATRVTRALDGVRPYLRSHGGDVELLGIDGAIARLRLQGSCNGCPSSAATLRDAVDSAVRKAAPELDGIDAGSTEPAANGTPRAPAGWIVAGAVHDLIDADIVERAVGGVPVLFVRARSSVYAYRPACPGCDATLVTGALAGGQLTCAGCGRRYDVPGAGRCLDSPALHLDPIPLVVGAAGQVRVAVPVAA